MKNLVNPYQAGRPVATTKMMFGRAGTVTRLEQQLATGQRVVLLFGPPLIGKSSLALHLPELLSLTGLAFNINLNLAERQSLDVVLREVLRQLLERLSADHLIMPADIDTSTDTVLTLSNLLLKLHQDQTSIPLALVFDDLHLLAEAGRGLLLEFLETLTVVQSQVPSLQVIFLADSRWADRLDHPLLDAAPVYHLGPLAPDDALQLITRPVEGMLRFDYGVTRRIAEISSQHPYYLTLFCYTLFTRHAREGWVNRRYVDETLDYLLQLRVDSFERLWDEADLVERAALAALSAKRGAHGPVTRQEVVTLLASYDRAVEDEVVVRALEALADQFVLVRMGASSYRFYVEMFRYWIDARYKPADVVRQIDWAAALTRAETGLKPAEDAEPPEQAPRQSRWLAALVALALVGLAALGGLTLVRSLGWLPSAEPPEAPLVLEGEAQPRVGRPAPEATPTVIPAPTVPPTPTPPVVVARMIPAVAYMARDVDGSWRIHLMNSDGSETRPLSAEGLDDTSPAWSFDGRRLAYVSQRDGNREIYVMDIQGGNGQNLTRHPADDWTPAWSPDGRQIAFSSNRFGGWEIFVLDATCLETTEGCGDHNLRQLTNDGGGNISPVWSPSGGRLAYSSKRDGNWEIYSMAADGTDVRRLTNSDANDLAPAWSPSSESIAFETNRDGDVEVYVMSSVGGNPHNISLLSFADDHGPTWSPDGERLLFYSNREGNWDLFLTSLDGGTVLNLTRTTERDEQTPAWRP